MTEPPEIIRPEVSIIIPIYNGANFINNITEYLARQYHQNCEILFIVSDRSTDSSLETAHRYTNNLGSANVLQYRDTCGLGGAKNFGMDHAHGRYLWFLDADDIPSLSFLDVMVEIKKQFKADLVGCNFVYGRDRKPFVETPQRYKTVVMNRREALRARATEQFPVASWSMLYDNDLLQANHVRFRDGMCEDIVFTYRAISVANRICYYRGPLYKYVLSRTTFCSTFPDVRGQSEIDNYDWLATRVHQTEDEEFLLKRFTLLRMRSAGHLPYRSFMTYVKGEAFRQMLAEKPSAHVMLEGGIERTFSTSYYLTIRLFFMLYYYRSGRMFTRI